VAQMGIGEFARRSRLPPKALRLYDELGLVRPARVDTASGYRFSYFLLGKKGVRSQADEQDRMLATDAPPA